MKITAYMSATTAVRRNFNASLRARLLKNASPVIAPVSKHNLTSRFTISSERLIPDFDLRSCSMAVNKLILD